MLTPFRKKRSSRQKNARRILEERNVSLPDADLSFLFQRDGCRTLRMTVRADGSVRVKAPASIPWENVLAFVRSRLDWVREKRAFFADHRGVPAPAREGSAALYLGRAFALRPVPARRTRWNCPACAPASTTKPETAPWKGPFCAGDSTRLL